jgi:large subunit ribosomal protein L34
MLAGHQIRKRKRKRVHGFLRRQKTKKGALVIKKRRRKGRKKLSV